MQYKTLHGIIPSLPPPPAPLPPSAGASLANDARRSLCYDCMASWSNPPSECLTLATTLPSSDITPLLLPSLVYIGYNATEELCQG